MKTIVVSVRFLPKKRKTRIKLPTRSNVGGLLKALDLNPQTVVVRRDGKIVAERENIAGGDLIEIIPIVTGG